MVAPPSFSKVIKQLEQQSPPNLAEIIKKLEEKPRIGYSPSEWLGTFRSRFKCNIPASDVESDLTDFPVLLYINGSSGSTTADITAIFDENGDEDLKVAVTTSDGVTQCPIEVVSWDSGGETAELWTKLPSISSTVDTVFYFYFDDNIADNSSYVGVTGSTIAETVWDADFKLVCHMEDNPDTSHVMDSTGNDADGTKKAANEPIEATGKIGKGQQLEPTDDYIEFADVSLSNYTIEFWYNRLADSGDFERILSKSDASNYDLWFQIANSDKPQIGHRDDDPTSHYFMLDSVVSVDGDFHYFGGRFVAGDKFYINYDGSESSGITAGDGDEGMRDTARKIWVGRLQNNYLCNGTIDELRISDGARSSAWIDASYETQRDHFVEWQQLQYRSPYFMEAIKNVGR